MKRAAIRAVVFLLTMLPLALYAAETYRVTVTLYPGDSASDERIGTIDLASQNGGEVTSDWTFRDMGGQVLRRMRRSSNGAWTWKEDYIYRDGQLWRPRCLMQSRSNTSTSTTSAPPA